MATGVNAPQYSTVKMEWLYWPPASFFQLSPDRSPPTDRTWRGGVPPSPVMAMSRKVGTGVKKFSGKVVPNSCAADP